MNNKAPRKMGKDVMNHYLKYIDKNTDNGFLFGMIRNIQNQSVEAKDSFSNWGEFYWFLRDKRDEMKNG